MDRHKQAIYGPTQAGHLSGRVGTLGSNWRAGPAFQSHRLFVPRPGYLRRRRHVSQLVGRQNPNCIPAASLTSLFEAIFFFGCSKRGRAQEELRNSAFPPVGGAESAGLVMKRGGSHCTLQPGKQIQIHANDPNHHFFLGGGICQMAGLLLVRPSKICRKKRKLLLVCLQSQPQITTFHTNLLC